MVTLMVLPREMLHLIAAAPTMIQGKIFVFIIYYNFSGDIRMWILPYNI